MTKPVLFVSFRPLERAENLKAIYDAYPGPKVHMLSTDNKLHTDIMQDKYDIMVTDDIPSITPGKCIMIWHGIQGGKKICMDQPGHPYYDYSFSKLMTYIISASEGTIPLWHQCTQVSPSHIMPYGFPRTDQYIGKKKGDGNTTLANKVAYLFVPTFRDSGETPYPNINWKLIDDNLTDNEVLAVKVHPWEADHGDLNSFMNLYTMPYKHIAVISATEPTTPYLYDADVVITDYSSIMFDAYLLDKPVVLFEKERGYTETRGMYYEYPHEYCSFYTKREIDLVKMLRYRFSYKWLTQQEQIVRDIVAGACDGHSCERIISLIDSMKGDD